MAAHKPLRETEFSYKDEVIRNNAQEKVHTWKNIENLCTWDFFHYAFYQRYANEILALKTIKNKVGEVMRAKITEKSERTDSVEEIVEIEMKVSEGNSKAKSIGELSERNFNQTKIEDRSEKMSDFIDQLSYGNGLDVKNMS